jgi:hypothetical protein
MAERSKLDFDFVDWKDDELEVYMRDPPAGGMSSLSFNAISSSSSCWENGRVVVKPGGSVTMIFKASSLDSSRVASDLEVADTSCLDRACF